MLGRLILLFLLTPAIELGLLIQVDRFIGFWPTIGLIVGTGLAGSYLARREGLSAWQRLNRRLAEGGLPGKELIDGVIILVAGALLITPGVLTDFIGFIGLIPFTRIPIRNYALKRLKKKMADGSMRMEFGAFGVGAPSSPSPSPPDAQPEASWEGSSRTVPRHAEDVNGSNAPPRDRDTAPSDTPQNAG